MNRLDRGVICVGSAPDPQGKADSFRMVNRGDWRKFEPGLALFAQTLQNTLPAYLMNVKQSLSSYLTEIIDNGCIQAEREATRKPFNTVYCT